MTIVNTRIDARLIHGQVATMWSNYLKAQRILVANDVVARDQVQKMALRMACPDGIALSVLPVDTAAEHIQQGKYENQRLFIILNNPEDALRLVEKGVRIPEVNVGNMSHKEGQIRIKETVSVTNEDIKTFKSLSDKGVSLIAKMVPNDNAEDVLTLIAKAKGGE